MKLLELAQKTNSQIEGSPELEIESIAPIPQEAEANQLALIFPGSFSKARKLFKGSEALAYLISEKLNEDKDFLEFKSQNKFSFVISKRPKFALQQMIGHFEKDRFLPEPGIHPSAFVDPSAQVDPQAHIGAQVYIGPGSKIAAGVAIYPKACIGSNTTIGENTLIKYGVCVEDYSEIGSRVIIHPNAVIGADGYSYTTEDTTNLEKMQRGEFNFNMERQIQHKVNSAGNVIIEDDVEIGANTCIDRGTLGPTKIGEGTKIDNLCQIAHNVQIGKDCLIIAQTGIAGSAKIGDRVTLAGASGVGDGVEIGNDAVLGAFSGANSNIDPFMPMLGVPAIPYGEYMKRQRAIARLPKQQEEIRRLKSKVEARS